MASRIKKLLTDLSFLRRYRRARADRLPIRVHLPFVRNQIRHAAHESWPGGYIFNTAGSLMYVPGAPVDNQGGYSLLKPYTQHPIIGALCKPGETFVDVGANIGAWTLAAAHAVGTEGHVLAFEPTPRVAETLRKTLRANRLRQVKLFEVALAESSGRRPFSVERGNTGGSRLGRMSDDARRSFEVIEVATARLDDIARSEELAALDVMKVDVEGFEHDVLRGSQEVLRSFKPVLILETGHENAEARAGIHQLLSGLGYAIIGLVVGDGLIEASWDDYVARRRTFAEVELGDMVLMP
jgi:FkbM family methyltransferase